MKRPNINKNGTSFHPASNPNTVNDYGNTNSSKDNNYVFSSETNNKNHSSTSQTGDSDSKTKFLKKKFNLKESLDKTIHNNPELKNSNNKNLGKENSKNKPSILKNIRKITAENQTDNTNTSIGTGSIGVASQNKNSAKSNTFTKTSRYSRVRQSSNLNSSPSKQQS